MKFRTLVSLLIAMGLLLSGPALMAQEETDDPVVPAPAEQTDQENSTPAEAPPLEDPAPIPEEPLIYDDYTVKGYAITVFGGQFSGAKYLENMDLPDRTILASGAGDIMGYDGEVLLVSQDPVHYTGAHKEIKEGPAYGARIGIYISDDFHMDLLGTYATGQAVTTMRFTSDPENFPDKSERIEVDKDDGYKMFKGGLALMYDATPATFFGIVPRLGFGLGGIINRYSELSDVTGLYLEGNFGLNFELFDNFQIAGQVDLTNFAYDVEELGYSNMVNFVTFSLGLTVYLDVVPPEVRASHMAEKNN
ncbi:MAG: hypothetical protein KAH56_01390 [Candidatus Krumholzibacteria bacterium]|nr:hypothetical protein [Candidatus Krumholzibacteria bacterium]